MNRANFEEYPKKLSEYDIAAKNSPNPFAVGRIGQTPLGIFLGSN
jgi:hypothetical protein